MDLCVLIVDDDVMLGKIQKALLQSVWPVSEPILCDDGLDALEQMDQQAMLGKQLLVLLDINMPSMCGWDVLDALADKSYREKVWVVLNTSSEDVMDEFRSKSYIQVIGFNKKPLTTDALLKLMVQDPLAEYFD